MQSVARSLHRSYAADPESVAQARRALGDFAAGAGAAPRLVEAVRLATSEAVTNAVRHAYGDGPGYVHVTAGIVSDELWVLIADDGGGLEPRSGRPGLGLGLCLIAQLSDRMAIVARAGGGTEVRMRFDFVAAGTASARAVSMNGALRAVDPSSSLA